MKKLILSTVLMTGTLMLSTAFAGTASCSSSECTFKNLHSDNPSAPFWIEIKGDVTSVTLKNADVKIRGFHSSQLTIPLATPEDKKRLAISYFDAKKGAGIPINPKVWILGKVGSGSVILHSGDGGKQQPWYDNHWGSEGAADSQ